MHVKIHEDNLGDSVLGQVEHRQMMRCFKHYAITYQVSTLPLEQQAHQATNYQFMSSLVISSQMILVYSLMSFETTAHGAVATVRIQVCGQKKESFFARYLHHVCDTAVNILFCLSFA